MMRFLVFIAPNNFKDETLAMVKTFFNRWNVQYHITSYSNKECVGWHGAVVRPDVNAGKIVLSDYDGMLIVDGQGFTEYKLSEYRPFLDTITAFNENKKTIVAINNSIMAVARANIVKDKKISTPQNEEVKRQIMLFRGIPSDERVEIMGNLITIKDSSGLEGPLQDVLTHIGVM